MPMGWTDSITSGPIASADGNDLRVSWESSSPPGTTFQVYLDRRLARATTTRVARFALPIQPVYIDVIAVDPGSERVDFSAELAPLPARRATIEWSGGRYLSETIRGFHVHQSAAPGGPVAYDRVMAFVAWAPLDRPQDGFGIGGFGCGGFG